MRIDGTKAARRIVLEVVGWTLVVAGIAMIFLPGPGLLGLLAGLIVLSQQYDWARRRIRPVRRAAMQGASNGVQSWPKIAMSLAGVAALVAFGVLWIVDPPAPSWWPLDDRWWLVGGMGTGITLCASAAIALALLVYSFRRFRARPYDPERDDPDPESDPGARPHGDSRSELAGGPGSPDRPGASARSEDPAAE